MSKARIFFGLCLLLGVHWPAMALEFQEGMHGMQWGRSAAEFAHLSRVRESGPVAYYVPSGTIYQAAGETVPTVVYGFYRDRFFAAYIRLGSPVQFNNLKRHFSGKYGPPKAEHDSASHLTVLRWQAGDVNVKLKLREPGQEIKMAVYFAPLAGELERAQLDDIPADLYRQTAPGGEQPTVPQPLIE